GLFEPRIQARMVLEDLMAKAIKYTRRSHKLGVSSTQGNVSSSDRIFVFDRKLAQDVRERFIAQVQNLELPASGPVEVISRLEETQAAIEELHKPMRAKFQELLRGIEGVTGDLEQKCRIAD